MQISTIDWLLFFGELIAVLTLFAIIVLVIVVGTHILAYRFDSFHLGDINKGDDEWNLIEFLKKR